MQFKQYITTSRKQMPMIQSGKQTIHVLESADIINMKRAQLYKKRREKQKNQ